MYIRLGRWFQMQDLDAIETPNPHTPYRSAVSRKDKQENWRKLHPNLLITEKSLEKVSQSCHRNLRRLQQLSGIEYETDGGSI